MPSPKTFDETVSDHCDGLTLMYAARTRKGLTPA